MMKHLAKMIVKKILIAATAAPLQIQPRVNPQKSLPLRKEVSARGSVTLRHRLDYLTGTRPLT